MQLPPYSEAADEVGNQLSAAVEASWYKIDHSDQEVSDSLVAPLVGNCYIGGQYFERGPDIVLMHLTAIAGLGAATSCTDVPLAASLLNIVFFLEPVVPLSDLIQNLVDTQVTWRPTM
jgi:hypothetical protein